MLDGQRSSILLRINSALEIASEMAHSRAGQGLLPISFSFRADRILAENRIAYLTAAQPLRPPAETGRAVYLRKSKPHSPTV